jgi:hypothetical protein
MKGWRTIYGRPSLGYHGVSCGGSSFTRWANSQSPNWRQYLIFPISSSHSLARSILSPRNCMTAMETWPTFVPMFWPTGTPRLERIYTHTASPELYFGKDPHFCIPSSSGVAANLVNARDANRSRQKRLLSHAFSERSLRGQKKLILGYIDLLHSPTRRICWQKGWEQALGSSALTELSDFWHHWQSGFGEPFGCLDDSQYHSVRPLCSKVWRRGLKTGALLRAFSVYPILALLPRTVMPKKKVVQTYISS